MIESATRRLRGIGRGNMPVERRLDQVLLMGHIERKAKKDDRLGFMT